MEGDYMKSESTIPVYQRCRHIHEKSYTLLLFSFLYHRNIVLYFSTKRQNDKKSINLFLIFLSNNNKSCILANKSNHIRK